jgi:hypothetical protein
MRSVILAIIILTLTNGVASLPRKSESSNENDLQTKKAWDQSKGGLVCGSAWISICLSSIPTLQQVKCIRLN